MNNNAFYMGAFEKRDEEAPGVIAGRAIVFNQRTDLGPFDEIIDERALDAADLRDVRLCLNHDTSFVYARSRNNNENSTMQMTVTNDGMDIRVDLDTENNAEARALYSAVKRGDMTGMSFMFTVDTDKDMWKDTDTDYPKRTIMSIRKVFEVSAVAFPAYPQTSIQAASEDGTLDSAHASLESARKKLEEERAKQAEDERRLAALERLEKLQKEVKDHDF